MAPELIKTNDEEKSGLSTNVSDVFALGMVTFEVSNVHCGRLFHGLETPSCTSLQIFTGEVPFPEYRASAMVMRKIMDGDRPQRPSKGKKYGLSDDLWEIIQSSLAHRAEERPHVGTFVEFLEKAIPNMDMLKELTKFDANSEDDIRKLCKMFEYGDNALSGMREDEALVVIEVFDRVGSLVIARSLSLGSDFPWPQVLTTSLDDAKLRSRCLRGLQKVSTRCGLLPKSYRISHSSLVGADDDLSVTRRVSKTCQRSIDGQLVAVKTINPDCIDNFNGFKHVRLPPSTQLPRRCSLIGSFQKLYTNAVMWKRLRHPNVVSFLGFDSDCPPFSLVSPWMVNGNLPEYLRNNPDADSLGLVCDYLREGFQPYP